MRFQGLDLNLLVALDALLAEQSVSVAARKIHLSQSAMSGALARLREYFRDELLVPTGRGMVLTSRGKQLIEPVRAALLQIKNTITTKPAFDPASSNRRFTIMASDYAMVVALSEGLRRISRAAPKMSFRLKSVDILAPEQLERGEIDLLLTLEQAISREHPSAPLFEDDYVVVAWAGNTLIGERLEEDAYFELGHVGVDLGLRVAVLDAWYLQSGKPTRRIEMTVPNFTLAPHVLLGTDRIATMHRRLAELFARSLPLKLYPAPFELPRLREFIQWHRLNAADPATAWVCEQLIQALSPAERGADASFELGAAR